MRNVFEELHHLGDLGGGDRHNLLEGLGVEEGAQFRALGSDPPDHLGNVPRLEAGIAGIDALGRKTEKEVAPDLHAVLRERG